MEEQILPSMWNGFSGSWDDDQRRALIIVEVSLALSESLPLGESTWIGVVVTGNEQTLDQDIPSGLDDRVHSQETLCGPTRPRPTRSKTLEGKLAQDRHPQSAEPEFTAVICSAAAYHGRFAGIRTPLLVLLRDGWSAISWFKYQPRKGTGKSSLLERRACPDPSPISVSLRNLS